jgi:O-antigen ligase
MTLIQRAINDPLRLFAATWALILLAPFVPGLPRPTPSGLPWRQELLLALLFTVTLLLLVRQLRRSNLASLLSLNRTDLPLLLPVALFILWSAASILWAESPFPVLHHTFVWIAYGLFFLLMRRIVAQPRLLRASLTTLGVVVSILSLSCMLEFWGAPTDSAVRTTSLFRFFNGFGETLAVTIPLFAALALRLNRTRAAALCGATAVIAWLAMLQVLERAPIIGASAALFVLAAASLSLRQFRPRSLRRAASLLAAFVIATALQSMPSPLTEGRSNAFDRLQATSATESNTRVRFLFWGIGLEMLREHPLTGVGANNYDAAYPEARARFSQKHSSSSLIAMDEEMLVERAHNEYVQIAAELGLVGLIIFLAFCVSLIVVAWRALRRSRSPLALGAVCSLVAFALSSGASSASFRWMGGGLIFFFAVALVSRFSVDEARRSETTFEPNVRLARAVTGVAFVLALVMFCGRFAQTTNSILHGAAQASNDRIRAEQLYQSALLWNPFDASTHFNYGVWLYYEKRPADALSHLRYAAERGLNASVCYAYLASAEAWAGETETAEATLARAVGVYPRSVFLRVRHSAALVAIGKTGEAEKEFAVALSMDARTARGWHQLINFGRQAAKVAALKDTEIALPGALYPENCIHPTIAEYELRFASPSQTENELQHAMTHK